jgi:hypothetical protein
MNSPSSYELLPSDQQHLPLPLQSQPPATMPCDVDPVSHNPEGVAEGVPIGLPEGDQMGVPEGLPVGLPEGVQIGLSAGVPVGLPEGVPVGFSARVESTSQGPTTHSPAEQYNNPEDAPQAKNIPPNLPSTCP